MRLVELMLIMLLMMLVLVVLVLCLPAVVLMPEVQALLAIPAHDSSKAIP